MIASFIRSLFCLHKWRKLKEVTVEFKYGNRSSREDIILTEECEKCGAIRHVRFK